MVSVAHGFTACSGTLGRLSNGTAQHFRFEPTSTIKARMNEPINDESLINTGLLVLQHNYCNNRCMMHVLAAELKSAQWTFPYVCRKNKAELRQPQFFRVFTGVLVASCVYRECAISINDRLRHGFYGLFVPIYTHFILSLAPLIRRWTLLSLNACSASDKMTVHGL